jgi:hypothetical protein
MVALMDHYGTAAVAAQKMAHDHGWLLIYSPQSMLLVCTLPTGKTVIVVQVTRLVKVSWL